MLHRLRYGCWGRVRVYVLDLSYFYFVDTGTHPYI